MKRPGSVKIAMLGSGETHRRYNHQR